jgi:hypothetical protein
MIEHRSLIALAAMQSFVSACALDAESSDVETRDVASALVSPRAHWRFDEPGGGAAADATGNGHDGAVYAGASFVAGIDGNAIYLDGASSGEVRVPDDAALDPGTSDFSVAGWMATSPSAGSQYVISKRSACWHGSFWNLFVHSSGRLTFEVDQDSAGTNYRLLTGGATVTDGDWHHFALVRQGTSIRIYVDGALDASATTAAPTRIASAAPLRMGRGPCSGNYRGRLDDVRYFGSALSAADVDALVSGEAPPDSPPDTPPEPDTIPRDCTGRVIVRPILYVPSDASLSASARTAALSLLDQHMALAQSFYRDLLVTDTFCVEPAVAHDSWARAADVQYAQPDSAHALALTMLNARGEVRSTTRSIFVVVFVRPASLPCILGSTQPVPCFGGARPINGGVGTGGGFVQLEYSSLTGDTPYGFHSTLVHEIGHSLGLAHGDCHGEDMSAGFSIMVYNTTHRSHGLTPSPTPGGFIAEQYYLLDRHDLGLPDFEYDSAIHNPTGRRLVNVGGQCSLATMSRFLNVAGVHSAGVSGGYDLYFGDDAQSFRLVSGPGAAHFTYAQARYNCDWNLANQPSYNNVLCVYDGDVIGTRVR